MTCCCACYQQLQSWKDVYLRNIVAQTTHAAMLAQQQVQSLICAAQATQIAQQQQHKSNKQQQHKQQQVSAPPRLYFTSLAQQQQRKEFLKNKFDTEAQDSDEEPVCANKSTTSRLTTATTADADWKRWRRVNPVVGLHNRKVDASLAASLPLSPTFRRRSTSTSHSRQRKSTNCM